MGADLKLIKKLRQASGIGMLECKKAIEESGNDYDKAVEILRKKGYEKAKSKSSRTTNQGIIASYIHTNGRIGVMIELACETDFVSKNEDFLQLGKDISMQIAAMCPKYISENDSRKLKGGRIMSIIHDIAQLLQSNDLGTMGVDIYCSQMPDAPDEIISLYQYSGKQSDAISGLTYPGLQVRVRAESYQAAEEKIVLVENVLSSVGDEVNDVQNSGLVINDKLYLRIMPVQNAFPLGYDNIGRMSFDQNYIITLRRN